MKALAISPNSVSAANANKMKSAFGLWIEDIEKSSPAEWMESDGVEMYRDTQRWDRYINNFITRPLHNYHTGIANEKIIDEDGKEVDWSLKDGEL